MRMELAQVEEETLTQEDVALDEAVSGVGTLCCTMMTTTPSTM